MNALAVVTVVLGFYWIVQLLLEGRRLDKEQRERLRAPLLYYAAKHKAVEDGRGAK